MKKIDLSEKHEPYKEEQAIAKSVPDEPRITYPSLHLYNVKNDALGKLPKKGTAIVEYEVVSTEVRQVKGGESDDEVRLSMQIEFKSIEPIAKSKTKKMDITPEGAESESAMDAMLANLP